MNTDRS
jgi:hypothetical protein